MSEYYLNSKPLDQKINLFLENLKYSSDKRIAKIVENDELSYNKVHQILDPNNDGVCNLDDLIWHNVKLPSSNHITWQGMVRLFGEAPESLHLNPYVDQSKLRGKIVYVRQLHSGHIDSFKNYADKLEFIEHLEYSLNEISLKKDTLSPEDLQLYEQGKKKLSSSKKELEDLGKGLIAIEKSQLSIRRFLNKHAALHIFNESEIGDTYLRDDRVLVSLDKGSLEEVLNNLKLGILMRREILPVNNFFLAYGAALVYIIEEPKATMYATIPLELQLQIEAETNKEIEKLKSLPLKSLQATTEKVKEILYKHFPIREYYMQKSVEIFLAEHPGETAYIIFGGYHEFDDNFSGRSDMLKYEEHDLSQVTTEQLKP